MNKAKFLLSILTVCLSAAWIQAQPAVEQIAPNATQIVGVTDAKISPSGKFVVVQTDVDFYVVPIERLDRMSGYISDADYNWTAGWAKGFLPSGKILVKTRRGLYTSDPQKPEEGDEIYSASAEDEERGTYLNDGEMVVVTENLIISGSSDVRRGFNESNIIRFDVRRGFYARGAKISGFNNASLSPSGRYIVYEHGAENETFAEIYDIKHDVNRRISQHFNFKRNFPKYKDINVETLAWVAPDRFVATIAENQFELIQEVTSPLDPRISPSWIVLFDAATGKIVWKRQLKNTDIISNFQVLSRTKAFFENVDGIYEIALADGKLTKLSAVESSGFSFSPDKTRMAFFDLFSRRQFFVSSPNGADKKLVFEIPENIQSPGSTEEHPPRINWSPDGKRLLIFDKYRLFIVRLDAESKKESKQ